MLLLLLFEYNTTKPTCWTAQECFYRWQLQSKTYRCGHTPVKDDPTVQEVSPRKVTRPDTKTSETVPTLYTYGIGQRAFPIPRDLLTVLLSCFDWAALTIDH